MRIAVALAIVLVSSTAAAETPQEREVRIAADYNARETARRAEAESRRAEGERWRLEQAAKEAQRRQADADRRTAVESTSRVYEAGRSMPHTCASMQAIEAKEGETEATKQLRHVWYLEAWASVEHFNLDGPYNAEQLAMVRRQEADAVAKLTDAKCLKPEESASIDARIGDVHETVGGEATRAEKCIATKGCAAKEYATDLVCPRYEKRAAVVAEIAKVKKYGQIAGAVSLRELNALGEQLRAVDDEIEEVSGNMKTVTGVGFARSFCK